MQRSVRELENAIERALVASKSHVLAEEAFAFINHTLEHDTFAVPLKPMMGQIENQVITTTLQRTLGNVMEAALDTGDRPVDAL